MRAARTARAFATIGTAIVVGGTVIGGAAALLVPVGGLVARDSVTIELPEPELPPLVVRSVVYDAGGAPMAVLHDGVNRVAVKLADVPPVLIDAVLTTEDRDFYRHDGIDWRGIGRALATNLDAGAVRQGGSTITQQLVKNTMFDDPDRRLSRKVREAVLAVGLERRYTKDEILERYLNTIYLGHGAYGVGAAVERYFGKSLADVTLPEAALLAGLIANPEGRDPIDRPGDAVRARGNVLDGMLDAGEITEAEADFSRVVPLPRALAPLPASPEYDPFVEEVKRRLLRDERLGATYDERYRHVFEGGLRIYTTYDPDLQNAAELAVRSNLPADVPYTATLVALENETGAVRAMVAGTSVAHAGFNLATQGARQTGSAFKAFTLAAALEAGYSPDDRVNASGTCEFDMGENAPEWKVENYDGRSQGNLTLWEAIARSSNCAFARVALSLGAEKIVDLAHRAGIESPLEAVPSITLGTQTVSPLEMTSAFSTFAADGMRHPPRFLDRVETADGDLLFEDRPAPTRALDAEIARTVTAMLEGVIDNGTATRADLGRPAAGKTGTNQQYRDAWFVGYTPQVTAGVWIGNADAQVPITIRGTRVTGGSYPATIWHDFMEAAHDGRPELDFVAPDEERWPRGGSISEEGRNRRPPRRAAPPASTPESTPDTAVPAPEPAPPAPAPPAPPAPVPPPPAAPA